MSISIYRHGFLPTPKWGSSLFPVLATGQYTWGPGQLTREKFTSYEIRHRYASRRKVHFGIGSARWFHSEETKDATTNPSEIHVGDDSLVGHCRGSGSWSAICGAGRDRSGDC